jgi:hypothetical protein
VQREVLRDEVAVADEVMLLAVTGSRSWRRNISSTTSFALRSLIPPASVALEARGGTLHRIGVTSIDGDATPPFGGYRCSRHLQAHPRFDLTYSQVSA